MVRDKIISRVKSQEVREKLLTEDDLMMDRAIEIAVIYETTQQCLKCMAAVSSTADIVDAIKEPKHHLNRCHSSDDHTGMINCRNCGGMHEKNCPAFGKECLYCHT